MNISKESEAPRQPIEKRDIHAQALVRRLEQLNGILNQDQNRLAVAASVAEQISFLKFDPLNTLRSDEHHFEEILM